MKLKEKYTWKILDQFKSQVKSILIWVNDFYTFLLKHVRIGKECYV